MSEDVAIQLSDLTPFERRVLEEFAALRSEAALSSREVGTTQVDRTDAALAALESTVDVWLDEEHSCFVELLSRLTAIEASLIGVRTQMVSIVSNSSSAVVRVEDLEG